MRKLGTSDVWNFAGRALPAAAFLCGGLMSLMIALVSWLCLAGETAPFAFAVLYLAAGLAVAAATVFLCRIVPVRNEIRFCILLAAAAFMVRGLFVLLVPTEPVSDFGLLYGAAQQLARGNNILNDTPYFQRWAYQSGFVAWMALWIRLFGADVFFFQMTNCLFGAGCAVLVYLLARRFASPQGAGAAGILYLIYPGSIVLAPVLTNQHLSELLLLAALYVVTGGEVRTKTRLLRGMAAGLLLTLSNVIRPSAIVAVAAVLAMLVLTLFRWKELGRRGLMAATAGTLSVTVAYFLTSRGLSWLVQAAGLHQGGLANYVPEWKFVLGFNQETSGAYSNADADIVFASDSIAQANEAARLLLKERLSELSPVRLLKLFLRKIRAMWGCFEPTYWTLTQNVTDLYAGRGQGEALAWWQSKVVRFFSGIYIADSLLIAAGCVRAAVRPVKRQGAALLPALTALAFFCAQLLIEVQPRYRTLLFAAALPLAAIGVDWLAEICGKLVSSRKEKRKETRS